MTEILCTLLTCEYLVSQLSDVDWRFKNKNDDCLDCSILLCFELVKLLVAPVQVDTFGVLHTTLWFIELELLISAREVDVPKSIRLTDDFRKH